MGTFSVNPGRIKVIPWVRDAGTASTHDAAAPSRDFSGRACFARATILQLTNPESSMPRITLRSLGVAWNKGSNGNGKSQPATP
ncbi:MAG TPA: hypothetical protein VMU45_07760 [Candidatus Eisenbacteria bacterium]|nr:hypothetical protein [Candidatus Eisenbacteria bacterium]